MAGRIVVGVDGSLGSQQALWWGLHEALVRQASLDAVAVWQSPYDVSDPLWPVDETALADAAAARAHTAIETVAGDAPHDRLTPLVIEGDPAMTLCAVASDADLLVVGSRGHGTLAGALLGSVSSKCVHHSTTPVVVTRTHDPGEYMRDFGVRGRILVGVDGSDGSRRALSWAVEEAEKRPARVDALWVWRSAGDDMGLELRSFPALAQLDQAQGEAGGARIEQFVEEQATKHPSVRVDSRRVRGDPAQVLCHEAPSADLLVVGSRGHGSFADLLLGSVVTKCVHHCPGPVAVVPVGRSES